MKRYSILVREQPSLSNGAEYELCQCDSNPKALADAALLQKVAFKDHLGKRTTMPKFFSVRIRDNGISLLEGLR
jgi:hypothetical protein